VRPGHLRDAAEKIEHDTGMRVQIIGGALVMSPTPRGRQAVTIARVRDLIVPPLQVEAHPHDGEIVLRLAGTRHNTLATAIPDL
jgi:hypothetical protein